MPVPAVAVAAAAVATATGLTLAEATTLVTALVAAREIACSKTGSAALRYAAHHACGTKRGFISYVFNPSKILPSLLTSQLICKAGGPEAVDRILAIVCASDVGRGAEAAKRATEEAYHEEERRRETQQGGGRRGGGYYDPWAVPEEPPRERRPPPAPDEKLVHALKNLGYGPQEIKAARREVQRLGLESASIQAKMDAVLRFFAARPVVSAGAPAGVEGLGGVNYALLRTPSRRASRW